MKLLMNKKIIINDYIYEQFEEKRECNEKIIDKLDTLDKEMLSKYSQDVKLIR